MIAYLRGTILEKNPGQTILDVQGVGYDVTIPVSTFSHLDHLGGEARLYIHTHVREDAISLFGFHTKEEKNVFERLIGVSGIGPKLAVTILSGLATNELVSAIRNSDLTRLTKIPGVGKKTAERMVVELRDKLDLLPGAELKKIPASPEFSGMEADVLSALINLGSNKASAETAVLQLKSGDAPADFETYFRRALELVR